VDCTSLRTIRKKKRKRCKTARPPATACRQNRKSAGAILKSWKAASLAYAPTEPTAGGEVMKPEQLTDEQRQLLAQMQADMRQQPTQLTEVPWNEQTPAQRQQTLQRQRLAQQQQQAQQQQWAQTQPQTVQQPPRVQQPKPVQQQQPKQTASNQQPYQDLLQTPAHTNTAQPRTQAAAPVTRVKKRRKPPRRKTIVAG
jgi:cell division protein FtsN